jgi:hypothetical protein
MNSYSFPLYHAPTLPTLLLNQTLFKKLLNPGPVVQRRDFRNIYTAH